MDAILRCDKAPLNERKKMAGEVWSTAHLKLPIFHNMMEQTLSALTKKGHNDFAQYITERVLFWNPSRQMWDAEWRTCVAEGLPKIAGVTSLSLTQRFERGWRTLKGAMPLGVKYAIPNAVSLLKGACTAEALQDGFAEVGPNGEWRLRMEGIRALAASQCGSLATESHPWTCN